MIQPDYIRSILTMVNQKPNMHQHRLPSGIRIIPFSIVQRKYIHGGERLSFIHCTIVKHPDKTVTLQINNREADEYAIEDIHYLLKESNRARI